MVTFANSLSSHKEWGKYLNTSFLQGHVCVLWFPGDPKQNDQTFPLVPFKSEARGNSKLQEAAMDPNYLQYISDSQSKQLLSLKLQIYVSMDPTVHWPTSHRE